MNLRCKWNIWFFKIFQKHFINVISTRLSSLDDSVSYGVVKYLKCKELENLQKKLSLKISMKSLKLHNFS